MSSDGTVTVAWESRMGELLRNTQDLTKEIAKTTTALKGQGKEAQDVGNIQSRLQAAAKKTWEETRTGAEKSAQKVAELNTLYKRGYIDLDTYGRRMNQLGGESAGAFGKLKEFAGSAAGSIVGTVTVVGTLTAAVRQIGRELEAIDARQKRSYQQQLGEAGLARGIIRNLGGNADMTGVQAVERAGQIAKETGASRQAVLGAASGVLSARGSFSASDSFNDLAAAAKLDPSMDAQGIGLMAGASLDLRKAFGGTSEQSLGLLISGMQTARVEQAPQYANNIVKSLLGLSNSAYGLSAKEAVGLTSAFTNISGDKLGAESGTGALTFVKQLTEATAGTSAKGMSFTDKLDWLTTTPEGIKIRDQLVGVIGQKLGPENVEKLKKGEKIDDLHGEAAMLPAMLGILTPGSKEQREFQAAMAATPELNEAGKFYSQNLAMQQDVPLLQIASAGERARGSQESMRNDPERGRYGFVKEEMFKTLDETNVSELEKNYLKKLFTAQTAASDVDGTLLQGEKYLTEQINANTGAGVGGHLWNAATFGMGMSDQQLYGESEEQKKTNDNLRELINLMKELRDQGKPAPSRANGPRPVKPGESP